MEKPGGLLHHHQMAVSRQFGKMQTTKSVKWHMVNTTDNPGPDQHSPLDRLTPTQGKKKKKPE
jgi:hypothetical protein